MFTQLRESFAHTMNRMGSGAALSLILLLSAPLWCQSTARAEVIITEIMANPETGTEWIELTTKGEETENISNFKLYDVVSSPSLLITFPENTILTAGVATIIEINPDKLNNTGDGLTLYDPTGNIRVEVNFGQSTKGLSWQRTLESATYFEDTPTPGDLITSVPPSPTPSPANSPKSVTSTPPPTDATQTEQQATESHDESHPEPTTSPRQIELETHITALLASYTPKSFLFSARTAPQLATQSAHTNTASIPRKFAPPKSSAISFMLGGILISSASYVTLYVLEQKEIDF